MALILSGDTGPSFVQDAAMPAGSVLQVVQSVSQTTKNTTSTSRVNSDLSVSITPSSASNKILVYFSSYGVWVGANQCLTGFLYRNGANIVPNDKALFEVEAGSSALAPGCTAMYLDSPASTSALTYGIYYRSVNGGTVFLLNNGPDYGLLTITAMEIAG